MSVEERLKELGYTLPEAPTPKAVYVTAAEVDGMLYTAGTSCFEDGQVRYQGKLGHARSAVGVNELPMNVCIEIEMIVKVKD
jgi:enamine deaminase RidA (YjgF/YER057c/UK114 family)